MFLLQLYAAEYYNYMQQKIYPQRIYENTKRRIHYTHARAAGQYMQQNTY